MLQTTLIDMEWNWENLDIFSSKKLQSTDDIDESFNLSGVVGGSSSEVASTESSFKNVVKVSNLSFERSGKKKDSSMEASVCSSDQSIGLKLGKRTYFENNNLPRTHTKTSSSSEIPESSVSTMKKVKFSSSQNTPISRCQVEGCNLDLSSSKEYHRKHRVCENHSKSLKVVVGGLERRFCQQCSRFHGLSEFDGKKRSCRRRLSDHNARRRKPQQETIQFNSRTLSSSLYDGREQLSFVFNNLPLDQTKPTGSHYLNDVSMPFNRIMSSSKGTTAGVYDQEALDLRRALSLLSNDSWGSCDPDLSVLHHPMPQGLPLHPPEYMWQVDQPLTHPHTQESHLLKAPYVIQYGNPMDEILKPL